MSRRMARGLLSLAAAFAVVTGFSSQAAAAPPSPSDPDTAALREAVKRDLGISWEEYLARGAQADRAARLDRQLAGTAGYRGVVLRGNQIVVTGDSGGAVTRAARDQGARVVNTGRPAASAQPMLEKYLAEVGAEGLSAVQVSADGWVITVDQPNRPRTQKSGGSLTPREFAERNPGVELRAGQPAERRAEVLGGQGWVGDRTVLCSVGFAGFDGSGRQEMLSAGHCTHDGTVNRAQLESDSRVFLGNRTFDQFGGPNNATNTRGTPGTDISTFAGSSQDILPMVDTYGGRSKVTGTTAPVVGAPVCGSGRTTRNWRCSTISAVGPFAVYGFRGDGDLRWVNGFETRMVTKGGDSGGSMVSGLKAIGVLSAGGSYNGVEYSYGSDLSVFSRGGHQVELWLAMPTAPPAAPGGRVTGRVPVDRGDTIAPGTRVQVVANGATSTVPVAGDGSFTFTAPANGNAATLTTVNGFSRSAGTAWDRRYGAATGPRICGLRDGGCFQTFSSGSVYWSPKTGEHLVKGRILQRWGSMGWETGRLGYPTSGERCGLVEGGCWQSFQGGRMYWSPGTDAQPIWGAIGEKWDRTGFEHGTLGYPTGPEYCGLRDGGCLQRFERGSIYWSPGTGAHWIRGAIRERWGALGWETGKLGYPTSDEQCWITNGCFQTFTGGSIYWSPPSGAWAVWGAIREYWGANGWESGRFGYPTSGERCSNAGSPQAACQQNFQRGTISWSAGGGARG